jgi:hypothetical protein
MNFLKKIFPTVAESSSISFTTVYLALLTISMGTIVPKFIDVKLEECKIITDKLGCIVQVESFTQKVLIIILAVYCLIILIHFISYLIQKL